MEMKKRITLELRNRAPEKVRGGGAAGRAPAPAPGRRLGPSGAAANLGQPVAQEPRGARAALPGPGAGGGGTGGPPSSRVPPSAPPWPAAGRGRPPRSPRR